MNEKLKPPFRLHDVLPNVEVESVCVGIEVDGVDIITNVPTVFPSPEAFGPRLDRVVISFLPEEVLGLWPQGVPFEVTPLPDEEGWPDSLPPLNVVDTRPKCPACGEPMEHPAADDPGWTCDAGSCPEEGMVFMIDEVERRHEYNAHVNEQNPYPHGTQAAAFWNSRRRVRSTE